MNAVVLVRILTRELMEMMLIKDRSRWWIPFHLIHDSNSLTALIILTYLSYTPRLRVFSAPMRVYLHLNAQVNQS